MLILALDTSTTYGSIALCNGSPTQGSELLLERELDEKFNHSEKLVCEIENLIHESGRAIEDIRAVAVAIGPGSFTGLRVSLATAKGIAMGLDIPLVGVSSLMTLAFNGRSSKKRVTNPIVAPLIDARRGQIYGSAVVFEKAEPTVLVKENSFEPRAFFDILKRFGKEIQFTGNGARPYEKEIKGTLGKMAFMPDDDQIYPHASYVAKIAISQMKKDDLATLVPNYIRNFDLRKGSQPK